MRIAISPDENPGEPGEVAADGTEEATLNAAAASALQGALQRCGQDAWFDPSLTREERVARANADGTAVLVVCSHNVSTPGLSGTQFVFCPGGQAFGRQATAAEAVYGQLSAIANWPARIEDAVADEYECCEFNQDTVSVRYLFLSPDDESLCRRSTVVGPVWATMRAFSSSAGA